MRSRLFHAVIGVAASIAAATSNGCGTSDAVTKPVEADALADDTGATTDAADSGATDTGAPPVEDTRAPEDSTAAPDTRADAAADSAATDAKRDAVTDVPTDADGGDGWHTTK